MGGSCFAQGGGYSQLTASAGPPDNALSMRAYLSGSIEYSPDFGKAWRAQMTPFLQSLGDEVYDPAQDEKKDLSEEEAREFRRWKTSDLARFQATVRKIIAWDLDWIERRTDYVVCYWDEHAGRGAGTQGELTFAHRAGIPVYLVLGMPREKVSGWILGCASEVFGSFEELKAFLAANRKAWDAEDASGRKGLAVATEGL